MLDVRYHVISLVAVFLALAIGVLLGTTLVERGLIAEQKSEIQSLKKTFDEIKDKNKSLHDELKLYQDFSAQSGPYLIENRLAGLSFVVITKQEPDEGVLGKIYEAVSAAGGGVTLTITMASSDVYSDSTVIDGLANLFQLPPDPQALKERVFAEIANQLRFSSNPAILNELERIGVIKMRGGLPGPVAGAILLPGKNGIDKDSPDNLDVPLIRAFQAIGFPVIGVGGSQTEESVFSAYKKSNISTVDHVETLPGQVAMVMVLQGREGNYGHGDSASRLIPEPQGI